jgi:hypothetical protein
MTHLVIVPAAQIDAANTLVANSIEPFDPANLLTFQPARQDADGNLYAACGVSTPLTAALDNPDWVFVESGEEIPALDPAQVLAIEGGTADTLAAMGLVPVGDA